ncbi:MAG TPA: hypothetical protein VKP03_03190 [Patescibacteria group bacterium]|nr:hypothetical protein [Patescibacteria group bacterium]
MLAEIFDKVLRRVDIREQMIKIRIEIIILNQMNEEGFDQLILGEKRQFIIDELLEVKEQVDLSVKQNERLEFKYGLEELNRVCRDNRLSVSLGLSVICG